MTFDKINRRTHLYLGMFLLAWIFMYGVSTIPMNHTYFRELYDDGVPAWNQRFEREYDIDIPPDADLRKIAARILEDAGMSGTGFGVFWRSDQELLIFTGGFWSKHQVSYFPAENRLVARDKRFRWDQFISGMHATGGYHQERFVNDAWAFVVDLVMVAILLWAATGLCMWWKLRQTRLWGAVALGSGIVIMIGFLLTL